MTLWKTERGSAPLFAPHARARHIDIAVLVAIPSLLIFWLIPTPLVLPILSVVSFVIACVVALWAHYSGVDRRAPGLTLWDIAAVFTLIWIGAGVVSDRREIVHLLDLLAMAP